MITNNSEDRYHKLAARLKERGYRMTSHRLALLRILSTSDDHPNASQLYQSIKAQFPSVSLATVYKTLAVLKEEGEILEVDLPTDSHFDGKKLYPHSHLVCTQCGRIIDGDEMENLEKFNIELEEKYGFRVKRHQIVFYGVCSDCQKKDSN